MNEERNNIGMNAVILACSSLTPFVRAAQARCGTDWPVLELDRNDHAEPAVMREHILERIAALPPEYDTVLVAMGFCGGAWQDVRPDRRVVIPRTDDCVSLLLHTDDAYCPNRKAPGHLYLFENDPADFSALTLCRDRDKLDPELQNLDPDFVFHMLFDGYRHMDIIDTGLNDCYSEPYVAAAQAEADRIDAELGYAEGGTRLLEKLMSGRWDAQFLIAEPGHNIRHGDFFE